MINLELQNGHDNYNLENIRRLLSIDTYLEKDEDAQLEKYRGDVTAEFKVKYYNEQTPNSRLLSVKKDAGVQSWRNSPGCCALVLVGYNQVLSARHCWVSPVALDFITEFKASEDICVFYILGTREDDDTYQQVLSFLIFRLLVLNRLALRDRDQYAELCAELQEYDKATQAKAPRSRLQELLVKIAFRVLNMFDSSKTIWIILDRLDQCKGKESRNLHRETLMNIMIRLVEEQQSLKVKVRVLGIVNAADWKFDEYIRERDQTKNGSIILRTFHQNPLI